MPSFFPALPQPAIVTNPAIFDKRENLPIDAFVGGMGSGLALSKNWMGAQEQANKLQQEAATQEALRGYAQTGDVGPVLQADPKYALALQKEERLAATDQAKMELEGLSAVAKYGTEVLPYFATEPTPEAWNKLREHGNKFGLNIPVAWSKEWYNATAEGLRGLKGRLGLDERMEQDLFRHGLRMDQEQFKHDLRLDAKAAGGKGGKGGAGGPAAATGPLPAGLSASLAARLRSGKGSIDERQALAWFDEGKGTGLSWTDLTEKARQARVGVVNPLVEKGRELGIHAQERKAVDADAEDIGDYEWYKEAQKRKGWGVMTFGEWKANGKPTRRELAPSAAPSPGPIGGLPQQALDRVRAANGQPVTFKNGQTWIFRNGQSVRIQ